MGTKTAAYKFWISETMVLKTPAYFRSLTKYWNRILSWGISVVYNNNTK
jgi:hypothetical protein